MYKINVGLINYAMGTYKFYMRNLKEGGNKMVQVGQKAPDFTAKAYYQGKFTEVKLSDYAGKWIMLCFYPGDFTYV